MGASGSKTNSGETKGPCGSYLNCDACGKCCACKGDQVKQIVQKYGQSLLSKLGLNFSIEDWVKAHSAGTEQENHSALEDLGTDLKKPNNMPTNLTRCVFICCNTYTKPSYSLGVGPMNDSITVATYLKTIGFKVYFIQNPTAAEFMKYFKYFMENTKEYLIVYYSGHGASVDDKNGDEEDGKDEALVFDDNFIIDDDLSEAIATCGKPASSKICLFNDCCHSGTIYDLKAGSYNGRKMPENIMSISAARDSETAKQTSVGGNDSGVFTFYFFKLLSQNENLNAKTMAPQIEQYLKRFEQTYVCTSTSEEILNEPLFS